MEKRTTRHHKFYPHYEKCLWRVFNAVRIRSKGNEHNKTSVYSIFRPNFIIFMFLTFKEHYLEGKKINRKKKAFGKKLVDTAWTKGVQGAKKEEKAP